MAPIMINNAMNTIIMTDQWAAKCFLSLISVISIIAFACNAAFNPVVVDNRVDDSVIFFNVVEI